MADLFYSEKESIAFWVSGYDASHKVDEILDYLKTKSKKACELIKCKQDILSTMVIEKSRRYKYMRVFFAKVKKAPKTAYVITGENWTMHKWLVD